MADIRGILFDKDGTLIDFHATWFAAADVMALRAAGQDQHGVRFNYTIGCSPFCVTVLEAQRLPLKKRRLERGQQCGIHLRQIRYVHQG